ncbi:hypothetical protein CJO94_18075 (plasmid) [Ralstonia solanacearum]|nr:hypothetical protein CJO94_18075 [Ralstonia solanacearum]
MTRRLAAQFALRLHGVLIVLWSLAWGVACNKTLLWAGLQSPPWRYGVATLAAWLAMLAAFKLWLAYAGFTNAHRPRRARDGSGIDPDLPLPGGAGQSASRLDPVGGHGGSFGGGGASGDFEPLAETDSASLLGDVGGSVADGLSSADEFLPVALVIAIVVAIAAACLGVLTYCYAQGPMLLSEAAFEVLLAGGLVRTARRAHQADWLRTVVRKTAIPWMIVLTCAIAIGLLLR